ncbi:hypothetical protein VWM68_11225, partial [Campylobacter coli]
MKQFGLDRRTFKILLAGYIVIALRGAILLHSSWAHTSPI